MDRDTCKKARSIAKLALGTSGKMRAKELVLLPKCCQLGGAPDYQAMMSGNSIFSRRWMSSFKDSFFFFMR